MPMYLGPLGGLQEINPLMDFDVSRKRYGGTHVAIGGRKVVDVTGHRGEAWPLRWIKMGQDEMAFLDAIHERLVPGPLRLVFPPEFRRNRLSRSAAAAGFGGRYTAGITTVGGSLSGPADWHPDSVPAQGIDWSGWTASDEIRFDHASLVPVVPGETLTSSLWVRASQAVDVNMIVQQVDGAGDIVANTSVTVTLADGTWDRPEVTVTPAAGVIGLIPVMDVESVSAGVITIGGAQVELGSTATAWTRGGGAPVVAVDQMTETATWSPWTNAELTLTEL